MNARRDRPDRERVAARPDADGLFLALAPMDGVTDAGHRAVMTAQNRSVSRASAISMCVSEFVRVTDRCVTPAVLLRHCPELSRGGRTECGVPVYVQLLGGRPEAMAETAGLAIRLGALGVDLNFGCPANTVNRHDGGATLLKSPSRIAAVTSAVHKAVPPEIPVTVKIRTGWDSADDVVELAQAAESGGAAWLTIHGRTRTQLYRGHADWSAIGRATSSVKIPVVANGDLVSPGAVATCAAESGCRAFMVGRGVMGHPNLFRWIRGLDDRPLDLAQFVDAIIGFVAAGMRDRPIASKTTIIPIP